MASADDDEGTDEVSDKGKDDRSTITIRPRPNTAHYLKELVALGMYGKTPTTAAQRLIDEGIRRAIVDGLIEKRRD